MGRFDPLRDATRRAGWWLSTSTGLAWLFFAGLLLRLVLAPSQGFPFDMSSFAGWADRLAQEGPRFFYPAETDSFFVDYPPGYLYVLYALGRLSRALAGSAPSPFMLKLPAIAADLGLAFVAVRLAERLTPDSLQRRYPWRGAVAAAILLNPATFFISAVWGQVDSILAVLVLTSFLLLGTGTPTLRREAGGFAVLAVAVGTKPQAAFVLPFVLLLLVWRHVRGAAVEEGSWRAVGRSVGRIAVIGAAGALAGLALLAPFDLGPVGAWQFYAKATQTYTVTSVFAFNFWGAVAFWKPDLEGADRIAVFGVPALYIGLGAFAVGVVALVGRAWRSLVRGELEGRVLLFGGTAMTCLAFTVLTRIHDRYLFLAIAALAPLIAYRQLRRSFVVLSVLYLVNVYFPFVYYLEFDNKPAPRLPVVNLGPWRVDLFELLYGAGIDTRQMKLISLLTGAFCLFLAWRGWTWLERRSVPADTAATLPAAAVAPETTPEVPEPPRERWLVWLHPVGRRGAALAVLVFLLVAGIRMVGIGHPRGMYFDEVYHARTAGEYLQRKDVYEWTHPPLAKELIAGSLRVFGGFGVQGRGPAPPGFARGAVPYEGGVSWAEPSGPQGGLLHAGDVSGDCRVTAADDPVPLGLRPAAIGAGDGTRLVGGLGRLGPELVRFDTAGEVWRVPLPAMPRGIAVVGGRAFVVTDDSSLVSVSPEGDVEPLSTGAHAVAASGDRAWVTFPDQQSVGSWGTDGASRAAVGVQGEPAAVVAPENSDRVVVVDRASNRLETIETQSGQRETEITGRADFLASVPDSGLVWAAGGRTLRVIEPRGGSVLGRVPLPAEPVALVAEPNGRMLSVSEDGIVCVGGRPASAWRSGSVAFGAAVAALAFLIGLRLLGSLLAAGLASLFVAVDGLSYALGRIAMNDSYVTAFILATWFAVLSAMWWWGARATEEPDAAEPVRSRLPALAWLALGGLTAGAALASKWVAVYALAGVGLLLLWELRSRGREGLWGIAGGPWRTFALFALVFGVLPLGVYLASYVPYLALGHTIAGCPIATSGDCLLGLQKQMYDYHAHLQAGHPFGSSWYGWPFGHRAVWLFLDDAGSTRAEIWTVANPVVFLGGLAAMVALGAAAWRRRSGVLAVVVLGALVQYLPWTLVGRVTFLYHYLPVVPFLAIALSWWLSKPGPDGGVPVRRIAVVAGAAVATFVVLLPILAGVHVDPAYHRVVKGLFFWMI